MFSIYKIMSSLNRNNFTFPFPIWIPVISFSCLIALGRTSSTVLNGESRHPCLVPDLRGKVYIFSMLSMMLAMDLSYYSLYHAEVHSFHT